MAIRIECGKPEDNEIDALKQLSDELFGNEWVLLTSMQNQRVGREIDACLLGRRGMIILELKNHRGAVHCPGVGPWEGIPEHEQEKGSPLQQAEKCAKVLKNHLTGRNSSLKGNVFVDFVVLMTHPSCILTMDAELAESSQVAYCGTPEPL